MVCTLFWIEGAAAPAQWAEAARSKGAARAGLRCAAGTPDMPACMLRGPEPMQNELLSGVSPVGGAVCPPGHSGQQAPQPS